MGVKSWVILQNISNKSDVAADAPLFYNPNIHIGNKPFFNKQMFDSGIRRINDIINEDGSLLCFESFCNTYPDIRIYFLEYNSIIHAIRAWMKRYGCNKTIIKLTNPIDYVKHICCVKLQEIKTFF